MTELVDEITIKISIYPDRAPFKYASPIEKLRDFVKTRLGAFGPFVLDRGAGKITMEHGAVELEWSNTGQQEIPELSGGDN